MSLRLRVSRCSAVWTIEPAFTFDAAMIDSILSLDSMALCSEVESRVSVSTGDREIKVASRSVRIDQREDRVDVKPIVDVLKKSAGFSCTGHGYPRDSK